MDELLASITRLEGDNVVRGLQAMLDQAQTALRPATKASKNRPPAPPAVSSVDKRTLGRGIIALLAHAAGGGGGADAAAAVAPALAAGLRAQPWLWELFVRRHMADLLQSPGVVALLTQALAAQEPAAQGRGWAALAAALRATPAADLAAAPSLPALQQAALAQVSGCLRLISTEVLPSAAAPAPPAAAEIQVTPAPQLAAALHALLHLVVDVGGGEGQDGGEGPSLAAAGDASCLEGAAAYTSTLLAELCNPEAVCRMLQLESLQERAARAGGSDSGAAAAAAPPAEPRLAPEVVQRVHSTMQVATVLVEAVLMWPQLAAGAGPGADGDAAAGTPTAQLAMASSLLAVRWELAQLLAAAGAAGGKALAKAAPPPWSLRTCEALLAAAAAAGDAAGQSPALAMPPALVAHALELMRVALPTWPESKSLAPFLSSPDASDGASDGAPTGEPALLNFLRQVLVVQEACYTGILTPHAAVRPGPGHQAAMTTARHLHGLLLAEPSVGGAGGGGAAGQGLSRLLDFPGAAGALGIGHQGTRKRGGGGGAGTPAAEPKRRKKGGGAGRAKVGGKPSAGDDAVADLMRLLAAPLPALSPEGGAADGSAGQETTAAPASATTSAQQPAASGPSNPSSGVAPPPLEAVAPAAPPPEASAPLADAAPGDSEKKPARRRIVPQAMDPTPSAPAPSAAPEPEAPAGAAAPVAAAEGAAERNTTRGTVGRVVMGSSLDMDDAARDAMWSAYIADKERLVEMLGDSSYREWYDEAAHPVPAAVPRGAGVDAAFDAVFGGAGEGGGGGDAGDDAFASSLPRSVLETSLLYPWQAGLAAALELVHAAATAAAGAGGGGGGAAGQGDAIFGALASADQRKASAAAVLKVVNPNHSRNVWLAASKGAEALPASATLLHLVCQLRTLLMRTSRRTAPPTLSAYLSLALAVLEAARREDAAAEAAAAAAGPRKAPWFPLRHVGALVRSFFCYPPLMAASVDAVSARALARLAAEGAPPVDAAGYAAAALWLVVQQPGAAAAGVQRPKWLAAFIPEASAYPLVAATPSARAAAAAELLAQLAAGAGVLAEPESDDEEEDGRHAALLPAMDACAAAALRLAMEREPAGDAALPPPPAILAGNAGAEAALATLAAALCGACEDSAEALGAALDAGGAPDGAALGELEDRASLLGLGLELADAVELAAACGGAAWAAAAAALERAAGAQSCCLELLRSLPDDSPVYTAAVRGLDAAPMLALPGSPAADGAAAGDEGPPSGAAPAKRPGLSAYQRRKRLQDIQNPYLRVIVAESRRAAGDAADGEFSDLEDFIVANPERDYGDFIADHFPMAPDSGEDEEEGEEEEEEEGDGDEGGGD